MSEDEALQNKELMKDSDNEKDGEESSENDDDLEEDEAQGGAGLFVNPLLAREAHKKKEEDEEEWSDDDAEETKVDEKKGKNTSLLGKRKRGKNDAVDGVDDFFKDEEIIEVPADDPGTRKAKGYDSDDSDEIAEIRAIAKKMLRKKTRDQMIEDSYNRFTFNENEAELPTWFVEDESKHHRKFINLTKEEVAIEKE